MPKELSFRDKLKPSSTKSLKKTMEEEESKLPASGGNSEFLKLSEGLNKVRAFPPHPDGGDEEPFLLLKSSIWLEVENDEGKAGRRTFQNARIHAGTKHDIAEEYINLAKAKLSASKKKDDIAKLTNMTKYAQGNTASLGYGNVWIIYGKVIDSAKNEKLGILELKKTVRDAIKAESIIEDESEAIEVDPFTDPETGKPMLITYKKAPGAKEKNYKFQVSKNAMALTNEEIEWFEKQKPLTQLSMVHVKLTDFEKVLDGLRNYDDQYEIGVFESDEFEKMIETCKDELEEALSGTSSDEDADDETSKKTTKKVVAKKAPKKSEEEDESEAEEEDEEVEVKKSSKKKTTDEFDDMDRDELKSYKATNECDVKFLKIDDDDVLRDKLREWKKENETAVEEDEVEEDDEEVEEKVSKKVVAKKPVKKEEDDEEVDVKPKAKTSLADLKKKLTSGK